MCSKPRVALRMEKFLKRRRSSRNTGGESSSDNSELDEPPNKAITLQSGSSSQFSGCSDTSSSSSCKMCSYKDDLLYDPKWKRQYRWMDYNSSVKGMVCSVCTSFGKVPVQAEGAWVMQPVSNWMKATTLVAKHKSDWHKAAVENQKLSLLHEKCGGIFEQIISVSKEEKQRNRTFLKMLVYSLYFLVKQHIPHTTTFEGLITLQIENGDIQL